jgi:hypothetical protein
MTLARRLPVALLIGLLAQLFVPLALPAPADAQLFGGPPVDNPPRPPAPVGPPPTTFQLAPPDGGIAPNAPPMIIAPPPGPSAAPTAPRAPAPPAAAQPSSPMVPAGQVALMVAARYGRDAPAIGNGLHWRIFADQPDPTGVFRLVREDKSANPTFVLPPGGYVVHVSFGLANATKRVQLRGENVREIFELAAGGLRFEGRVGDSRIPNNQITFDVFRGSQFETGEKRQVADGVISGDVVLLPDGTYHVVSNYGDTNAIVRSDIRVQIGKLTDVVINHRAAVITLKLVNDRGGEALANTAWSVLTPGGDVIKEALGAFPRVVLAEGEYTVIARNEGKVFNGTFNVEPGIDREIEVLAR